MSSETRSKLEIAGMILAIGIAWGTLTMQIREIGDNIKITATHISKMEQYMSSHDKNYWKDSGDQP